MSLQDARSHANRNTNTTFGLAPKCKINRNFFKDILEFTYLLAENNGMKHIKELLIEYRKNNPSQELDILLGEIDLAIVKHWNEDLRGCQDGKKVFRPLDLEHLLYDVDVRYVLQPNTRIIKPQGAQ